MKLTTTTVHTYRGKWSSEFTVDCEWNLLSSVITARQLEGFFVYTDSQSRYCVDCKIKILRCCQFIATSLGPSDVGFAAWAAVIFLGCSAQLMSLISQGMSLHTQCKSAKNKKYAQHRDNRIRISTNLRKNRCFFSSMGLRVCKLLKSSDNLRKVWGTKWNV
jgi:hypothetical protein